MPEIFPSAVKASKNLKKEALASDKVPSSGFVTIKKLI